VLLLRQVHQRQAYFKILINLLQRKRRALVINLGHIFFNILAHEAKVTDWTLRLLRLSLFDLDLWI